MICKIIPVKVEEKVFSLVPKGHNNVLGAQKTVFGVDMD
jgi:hypothetical protein